MPRLAQRHTVIVPDLRGVGCSSLEPGGYDKQTMADDVHRLVRGLGLKRVSLVGHDLGAMVALAYTRSHPTEVDALAVSGVLIPGFGLEQLRDPRLGPGLPHLTSFARPGAAERLAGHERWFLARFISRPEVVHSDAFDAYVQAYSQPGRLNAAFGQYRALEVDAADNRRGLRTPLDVPVLAVGGSPEATSSTAASMRRVARSVKAGTLPGGGHYLPETRPTALSREVLEHLDDAASRRR